MVPLHAVASSISGLPIRPTHQIVPTIGLTHGLRLPPDTKIVDLDRRLRCRERDAKGRAVVSIR